MSRLLSNLKSLSTQQDASDTSDEQQFAQLSKGNDRKQGKVKCNKRSLPFVLSDEALFMWPEIASYSTPRQVINLQMVCTKIRQALLDASVGTRLMNRYWNAQWARLIWNDDDDKEEDEVIYNNKHDNNDSNSKSQHQSNGNCSQFSMNNNNVGNYNNNSNNSEKNNASVDVESRNTSSEMTNVNENVSHQNDSSNQHAHNYESSNSYNNNNSSRGNSSSKRQSSQRNSIKLVMISREKKLLLPSSLTRSEGRKNWRLMYMKEYPQWAARTFYGVGTSNTIASETRTRLAHWRGLNEIKSAAQLERQELTVEEALIKKLRKRGITIEMPNVGTIGANSPNHSNRSNSDKSKKQLQNSGVSSPLKLRGFRNAQPVFSPMKGISKSVNDLVSFPISGGDSGLVTTIGGGGGGGGEMKAEDKQLTRVTKRYAATREPGSPLTRDDYQCDRRQGARKGKHAKGMSKKWSTFDNFGDYDY